MHAKRPDITTGMAAGLAAILAATCAMPLMGGDGGTPTIDIVIAEGDIAPGGDGSAVTILNPPYTNSLGQTGFTVGLGSGERGIWHNDGIVWLNSDGLPEYTLTGAEGTMGIDDTGGFIYSPSTNGEDSVFTHDGLLLRDTDPAPNLPGLWATFNSRPRMTPDGTAFWIGGITDSKGGSTQGRVLWRCADTSDPASSQPLLMSGDIIDGFEIGTTGIGFAYDISDDGDNVIVEISVTGQPSGADEFVSVNGDLVAREGDPVGDGTNWADFRGHGINDAGDYVFAGNTSGGPSETAEFLAYNGSIIVRRGDVLDGIELASNWAVRWSSINASGAIAHLWEGGSGSSATGTLFVTHDPANVSGSTVACVSIGEELDSDGDGIADLVISDFNASAVIAPGVDFSDHPWVYLEVDAQEMLDGGELGPEFEAIIRVPVPGGDGIPGDLDGSGTVDGADLAILLGAWGPCPDCDDCDADLDGNCTVDGADLAVLLGNWG